MNRGVSFSDRPTPKSVRPNTAGSHAFSGMRVSQTGRPTGLQTGSATPTSARKAQPGSGRSDMSGGINSVTTLRSPSVTSNSSSAASSTTSARAAAAPKPKWSSSSVRSNSPSSTVGGSSRKAPSKNTVKRGYVDAKRATDKELQRHLQRLLNMKQTVRRLHDEISKEFSTLTVALEVASEARGGFEEDTSEDGSGGVGSGGAAAAAGMMSVLKSKDVDDSQVVQLLLQEGFSEEDIRKQLNYVNTLRRHNKLLSDLVVEGGVVLNELSLKDREVQHLASLIDRACDVDLQCMSDSISDTVVCNGSPMFPHRTIDDTDQVVEEGSEVCAKAGRLSLYIRRLVSTGKAEADRSAHDLALAMSISARVSARKLESTRREMEGVQFEIGRVQLLANEVNDEFDRLNSRLEHVTKTINLRETAKDTVFHNGNDFVTVALKREREELLVRCDELKSRQGRFHDEMNQLEGDLEKQELELKDAQLKNAAANRIGSSVPQQDRSGSSAGGSQTGSRSASRLGSVAGTPRNAYFKDNMSFVSQGSGTFRLQ